MSRLHEHILPSVDILMMLCAFCVPTTSTQYTGCCKKINHFQNIQVQKSNRLVCSIGIDKQFLCQRLTVSDKNCNLLWVSKRFYQTQIKRLWPSLYQSTCVYTAQYSCGATWWEILYLQCERRRTVASSVSASSCWIYYPTERSVHSTSLRSRGSDGI